MCQCQPKRCIPRQRGLIIKICIICKQIFEDEKIPKDHICDRKVYHCKNPRCEFRSYYKKNLKRHQKQQHKNEPRIKGTSKNLEFNCNSCQQLRLYKTSKEKYLNCENAAIKHALPQHNWLLNKIRTKNV